MAAPVGTPVGYIYRTPVGYRIATRDLATHVRLGLRVARSDAPCVAWVVALAIRELRNRRMDLIARVLVGFLVAPARRVPPAAGNFTCSEFRVRRSPRPTSSTT